MAQHLAEWADGKFDNSLICPHCLADYKPWFDSTYGLHLTHTCKYRAWQRGSSKQDVIFLGRSVEEVRVVLNQDPLSHVSITYYPDYTHVGFLHGRMVSKSHIISKYPHFPYYAHLPEPPCHEVITDVYLHSGHVSGGFVANISEGALGLLKARAGAWLVTAPQMPVWIEIPLKLAVKVFVFGDDVTFAVDMASPYGVQVPRPYVPSLNKNSHYLQSAPSFTNYLQEKVAPAFMRNVCYIELAQLTTTLTPELS